MRILSLLFLSLLLFWSCENPQPTSSNQPDPDDIDPYFVESSDVHPEFGPESITRNLIQDSHGTFWLGSWQGLFSYDADKNTFTNHTNLDGLRRYRAFCLLEDSKGTIWVGTIGAGVYTYDSKSFTNITRTDGLANNSVQCLFEDSQGAIWIGTQRGISRFDGKGFLNFTEESGLTNGDINSFAEAADSTIWIGTRGGLHTFKGSDIKPVQFGSETFTNTRCVASHPNGDIWLGGQQGLWRYNGESYHQLSTDFIGHLFVDSQENLWIAKSTPENIYTMTLFRSDSSTLQADSLTMESIADGQGQVFGIMEDRDGAIWYGTERGVCLYRDDTVNCFVQDKN